MTKDLFIEKLVAREDYIRIGWSGSQGFGEYVLYKDTNGKWNFDSECMDSFEDKSFLKRLFNEIADGLGTEEKWLYEDDAEYDEDEE